MKFFNTISQKIQNWNKDQESRNDQLKIFGLTQDQFSFLFKYFNDQKAEPFYDKNQILICPDVESAEALYASLKDSLETKQILFLPGLEIPPYGGILSSENNLYRQFYALSKISSTKSSNIVLVTTSEAFALKLPKPEFFRENALSISISDIISPLELSSKLVSLGYSSATSVEEPGTFSRKGEIFDIYPTAGDPIRLHYFDDMVEEIFGIDLGTQKTQRSSKFESIEIPVAPHIFSNSKYANILRSHIPMPATSFKDKFEKRKQIFQSLADGNLFDDYPVYVPLFFESADTILSYFTKDDTFVTFLESSKCNQANLELSEELRVEFDRESKDTEGENLLPEPSMLYKDIDLEEFTEFPTITIDNIDLRVNLAEELSNRIELNLESGKPWLNKNVNPSLSKPEYIKATMEFLCKEFKYSGDIIFSSTHKNANDEFKHLLSIFDKDRNLEGRVEFLDLNIRNGFFYATDKLLMLSEGDLFTTKKVKTKEVANRDIDLFAEQLSTLKEGDFVIHSEHGTGKYLGLESLDVGGSTQTDFMVLLYSSNDKVYVPVYKMNQIQKQAESTSKTSLDSLRSNKFSALKERAKNSVKKLAFDLLKLLAEREASKAYAFTPPDHYYNEFELAFPFQETPDQAQAIEDVLEQMQKPRPMDHLVCGDVGFGKTEVAMRAAFKAVEDQKQVAILVPTTILALQHYTSFKNRFSKFPVNIEFLSRFKTAKESKEIKAKLESGDIDIVIGTHALLASSIKFSDLGLVIVDEEQRFGVGHKEKLKLLKSSVDFLTLTATPIPRTMQLAFLGLRDLSLIQTAPPKRQSIKSYIIKEDPATLQSAILKEINRGGQVFIVHNRVNDMEIFKQNIQELVPNAKIIVAHGQMQEKELEKRMKAFYSGDYQILISTTIIESGLDIPNANTMIIDRADTYGLSQLHQLRGRIGRSDKKAYAYFVIPKTRNLTPIAEQRLKALQTYADMGSGFNIASCDLEIRGAGDILGGQQSGHIESIGLELYMELLKEAVQELKGEKKIVHRDIEISTPFHSYIPNTYIKDSSERLKQYKKLSNSRSMGKITEIVETLEDVYGRSPVEFQNLVTILQARLYLQNTGLKSLSVAGSSINLKFDKGILEGNEELRNNVVETFISRPKIYQFSPDFTVLCSLKSQVDKETLLTFAQDIAKKIVPS